MNQRFALALLLLGSSGLPVASAFAQAQPAVSSSGAEGLRIESQGSAQESDKEKLSRSKDRLLRMQQTLGVVLKHVEVARKARDIIKLNCLGDKLTQVKALLKIAEQSYIGLQEAVARGAEDGAQHEFAKIGIARQRLDGLRAEAEQCIGQAAYFVDEKTVVTVETPEGLPDVTTNPPLVEPMVINPPVLSPAN